MRPPPIAHLLAMLALGVAGLQKAHAVEQVVPVSATILSECRLRAGPTTLDLGNLNPLLPSPMAGGALAVELQCREGAQPRLFLDDQLLSLDTRPVTVRPIAPLRHTTTGDTLPFDVVVYATQVPSGTRGQVRFSFTLNVRVARDVLLDAPAGRYTHSLALRLEP